MNKKKYDDLSLKMIILSFCFFSIYGAYNLPVMFNMLFWALGVLFGFISLRVNKVNPVSGSMILMVIIMLINIRTVDYVQRAMYYLGAAMIAVFLILFFHGDEKCIEKNLKLLLLPAILMAIYVYIFKFMPSIYDTFIAKGLSKEQMSYNLHLVEEGYTPSVGLSIGFMADYLVYGIILLYSKIKTINHKKDIILAIFLFIALALIGRRGELLAALITIFIFSYIDSSFNKKKNYIILAIMGMLLVGFLIAINITKIEQYAGSNRILLMFADILNKKDISNGRNELYKAAIKLFKKNYIVGIGWGEFAKYGKKIITIVTNVHNIYLQLFCEIGIIGAVSYIGILLWNLITTYNMWKWEGKRSSILSFSIMLQLYILLKGVVDNSLYYDNFWIIYVLALLPIQYYWNRKRINKNICCNK